MEIEKRDKELEMEQAIRVRMATQEEIDGYKNEICERLETRKEELAQGICEMTKKLIHDAALETEKKWAAIKLCRREKANA
jgi:hypothetical protein